jgi:hypothetical protein
MPCLKTSLAVSALMLLTAGTSAQDAAAFTELSAERVDAGQVMLHATFEGGACQEVQEPTIEPGETEDTVSVTFPTMETAEVCTMQIVEIEIEEAIDAGEDVTTLDVTVLGTDGEVQVEGSTQVGAVGDDAEGDEEEPATPADGAKDKTKQ